MFEESLFEDEVRRIARCLWPEARFSGSTKDGDRERDGIFETSECIHIVEATISNKKAKAEEDAKKIQTLAKHLRGRAGIRAIRGWFVTRDEPTADQREVIRKVAQDLIYAASFDTFQSQIIDARAYLSARDNYPFGSVRDPKTQAIKPSAAYVEPHLLRLDTGDRLPLDDAVALLLDGRQLVFLGDYGAGKSMTLREIYKRVQRAFFKAKTAPFPVYLNLRDHNGQENPAELLERHARNVGFESPAHLVRAWRAGRCILLLDGFDELVGASVQGIWRRLKDYRRRAAEGIRKLLDQAPREIGVVLAGRPQFFDTHSERRSALGLRADVVEIAISDFTDLQLDEYLKRLGQVGRVPAWLPTRPLLIGSLAARGALSRILETGLTAAMEPAEGWDYLLDQVCEREARTEAGVAGEYVRRILERLATRARAYATGLGPIPVTEIVSTFESVAGFPADDRALAMLQRLPGLTSHEADEVSRVFIDEAFADACRGGDLFSFTQAPHAFDAGVFGGLEAACGELAIDLTSHRLGGNAGLVRAALHRSRQLSGSEILTGDLIRLLIATGADCDIPIAVSGVILPSLELGSDGPDLSKVQFVDCYVGRLELERTLDKARMPRFRQCYFGEIEGAADSSELPAGLLDEACDVNCFWKESAPTTDALLELSMELGKRVVLTILRKLYLQKGSARKEGALFRGLDQRAQRLVMEALTLLEREGLAVRSTRGSERLWMPVRSEAARVNSLISQAQYSSDVLMVAAADLGT